MWTPCGPNTKDFTGSLHMSKEVSLASFPDKPAPGLGDWLPDPDRTLPPGSSAEVLKWVGWEWFLQGVKRKELETTV